MRKAYPGRRFVFSRFAPSDLGALYAPRPHKRDFREQCNSQDRCIGGSADVE